MSGKWTPGPWRLTGDADHPCNARVTSTSRLHIAKVYATSTDSDPVCEANARLIAAAPTMAKALENAEAALSGVLASMPNLPTIEAVRDQCRAALSQARGEAKP